MPISPGGSILRKTIVAGIAALTLAGAAQSITPAEALPLVAPSAASLADQASPLAGAMVDKIGYRRYYRYHRWHPYHRYFGYRFRRGGVPVPCRGRRTAMSKRYC